MEAPSHTATRLSSSKSGHVAPHPAVRLIKGDQELSSDNPSDFKRACI